MKERKCRVCNSDLYPEPLLKYRKMPKVAQFFPEVSNLNKDKGIDLAVCQCSGCGLVQLDSQPVPYYREVVRAAAFSPEMKKFRQRQFADFIKKYGLQGQKVVEIGCGQGEYLGIMSGTGAKAYGLEAGRGSVNFCRKNGLRVQRGFLENARIKIADGPFQAFFLLSFLEHLPDPNALLKGIANNLSDEAVGLVEVPNFDMVLKKKMFAEFMSDHLLYFSKETLSTALKLNGFEVISCQPVWHDYIICATVKKRGGLDLSPLVKAQGPLRLEIWKYLKRYGQRRVAIWGAGHQALALMALLGIAGRIKYVVDSALFKQGKFTPATHLPIVAPETLQTDPVDAVIIMAASYSDEVARIIKQKYSKTIKIAVLRANGLEELDG